MKNKNTQKYVIMMGLPGSGKSTIAQELITGENDVIISTDSIREELFGSEADQQRPELVFQTAHKRIREALSDGKNVVFDATNLVRKYRKCFIDDKVVMPGVKTIGYLVATEIDLVLEQNRSRERVVPEDVIESMLKRFNWPLKSEGFDEIVIHKSNRNTHDLEYYLEQNNMDHDCPDFHKGTIMEHMLNVEALGEDFIYPEVLRFHDIGKYITKSFTYRGKPSDRANYFGHADVGAYLAACTGLEYVKCVLIATHMDQFMRDWSPEKIPSEIKENPQLLEAFYKLHELDMLESKQSLAG